MELPELFEAHSLLLRLDAIALSGYFAIAFWSAMMRGAMFVVIVMMSPALVGCASTWDTVSNRKWQGDLFSRNPMKAFIDEDPVTVLQNDPDGHARTKAMRNLTVPDRQSELYTQLQTYLSDVAANDPSPVVRAAAITALGKFRDDARTVQILENAYAKSTGGGPIAGRDEPDSPGLLSERLSLNGPSGYPPEVVAMLKSRCLEAMAAADHPSAQPFIAGIAQTRLDPKKATTVDRDVRLAAVSALGKMKNGVNANLLANIMTMDADRDPAIANRAHEGLCAMTGRSYPIGSPEWGKIVSPGMEIAPEPSMIERAAAWIRQ